MSLARTALRLQVKLALLSDPVIDAFCEGRVYDSRIGTLDQHEPVHTIILTTEDDDAPAFSRQNGGEPFDHTCDLVLEIALMARGQVADANGNPVDVIGPIITDAQMEADLDLLEYAAVQVLTAGLTPEARLLQTAVIRRVSRLNSNRFATDDGTRLAIRSVKLTVELKGDEVIDLRAPPTGLYANLPEPLRSVARAMPAQFYGREICDRLAARLPPAPTAPSDQDLSWGPGLTLSIVPPNATQPPSRADDIGAGRVIIAAVPLPDP